ncbi:unnamed protein product, partial [Rotaria sp. Silwood2]
MPIDNVTRLRVGQIRWGNWQWLANVSLYTLPKFNRQGSLIKNNSSRITVDSTAGTITIASLSINATGMYVLQFQLVSSNNEHTIVLPSNGILVKDRNVALIEINSESENISTLVSTMLSESNPIPELNIELVNIYGRSYKKSSSTSDSIKDSDSGANTGLNVGLVVGLVGGLVVGLLILIGVVFSYRAHQLKLARTHIGIAENDQDQLTTVDENDVSLSTPDRHASMPSVQNVESSQVVPICPTPNLVDSG